MLDVSSESSARQRIHMKNQALFSSKDKREKLKCRLLQFLFGTLRINRIYDGVEAETRKSQSSFQIIKSYGRLAKHTTNNLKMSLRFH